MVATKLKVNDDLTLDEVDSLLAYNSSTGELKWKVSRGRAPAGSLAGQTSAAGYRLVRVKGKLYMAHRLAYLLYHGEWPDEAVDHFDRCKDNNRISNLRPCRWEENPGNVGMFKTNTSGYQGVTRKNGRWRATISANGTHMHLGVFDSPEDAHSAYTLAKKEFHPAWNNTQTRVNKDK